MKTISYTAASAFLVSAGSAGASTFDFGVTATDTAIDPISALAVTLRFAGGLGLQLAKFATQSERCWPSHQRHKYYAEWRNDLSVLQWRPTGDARQYCRQ